MTHAPDLLVCEEISRGALWSTLRFLKGTIVTCFSDKFQ